MPRKDPHTGCMVMTTMEFFAQEAERNGTNAMDEMRDFWDEMEQENEAERKRLADPQQALRRLTAAIEYNNRECTEPGEEPIPLPVEILEVLEADYRANLRSENTQLRVRAKDASGKVGVIYYSASHWSGTYFEPPEEDMEVGWE